MSFETSRAKKWLYGVLHADATLLGLVGNRIFDKQADPKNDAVPYVIYAYMGGNDLQGLGTSRTLARPLFLVKMVGDGPLTEAIKDVADRIDEIVGKASSDISDGYVFHARRTQEIDYAEIVPKTSRRIDHLGGLYQVWAYPAT